MTKPLIKRAVIEINGGCNYRCKMCPQTSPGRGHSFGGSMCLEEFNYVLEELEGTGIEVVNLEGSGEASLLNNLPEYIKAVSLRGWKPFLTTNGFLFKGDLMKRSIDNGLSLIRFSVVGHDPYHYRKWTGTDNFLTVRDNAISTKNYIELVGADTVVASYHLSTGDIDEQEQVQGYIDNFIAPVGCEAEIWKMHNWASSYNAPIRTGAKKTCGRPFSPDIVIRAGGTEDKTLTVVPCTQVSGNDHLAQLGSLSHESLEEVWYGEKYEDLRDKHRNGEFDQIVYCKDCDFLIDDYEVLLWTNSKLVDIQQMKGVSFDMEDYRKG